MGGISWDYSHDPYDRPLGCNGRYGNSGGMRHRRRGEDPCGKCKASSAHYNRELRRGAIKPRKLRPCGTPAAAERHRAHGEPICFACRLAIAAKGQARRDREKASRESAKQGA